MHAADLGGFVLKTLVERNAIPADEYDDVVFGCVDTIGPLAGNIARTCWLAAGLPLQVPGVTVDRQCGSSQQAVHFAAQAVMSGVQDVVVAGGVQTMTQIPISSAMTCAAPLGFNDPFSAAPAGARASAMRRCRSSSPRSGSPITGTCRATRWSAMRWRATAVRLRRSRPGISSGKSCRSKA